MQWQKRRLQGVKRCYLARLAPQSAQDPLYIVPKAASEHSWTGLDSRGVFIVQVPGVHPSRHTSRITHGLTWRSVRVDSVIVRRLRDRVERACRTHLRVGGLAGTPPARAHGGRVRAPNVQVRQRRAALA